MHADYRKATSIFIGFRDGEIDAFPFLLILSNASFNCLIGGFGEEWE